LGVELIEYDLPNEPYIVSRFVAETNLSLGAMINPLNPSFLFVSENEGIMKGFILNDNKTLTANLTFNWNSTLWRGDVRWNLKGDICLFLA
jgi:hypothetical protein